uniref:SFRICE_007534 n=1 Tax=Spodoptera frugiperda TaxID=7108 RepID=A0A2H1VCB0_SPOFR
MTLCRTCLSKNDLKQLFPDDNLVNIRIEQLHLICGIKIDPNDGLSQLICDSCLNLFNGALKLREQSLKSEEILKKSLKDIKIEFEPIKNEIITKDVEKNIISLPHDNSKQSKKVTKKRFDTAKAEFSVRIEDFESSNDSDFTDHFFIDDLESINSDKEVTARIEDYESSDSLDQEFKNVIKTEKKDVNKINYWDLKEKELLERENRKQQSKEQDAKLLSLAAIPYYTSGPLKCTLCNKILRNVQNFKCHAKTHFEPENACEECGKKFVNPSHMRYHQQRMHGRRKRLACTKCSYRAVDPLQLQNHTRAAHTGERPYVCDVCGDSFRMRANIAQHMRRHFGVRNLQCDRCPAMFRSRSELTSHQNRVHYLLYTYHCYLCPETYKRPASVKKHLANVHGIQRHLQLPVKCVKTRRRSCDGPD